MQRIARPRRHGAGRYNKKDNGNISETHWITANDDIQRMYSYGYDGLNRLLDATFQKENDGPVNDYYGEHITGYDKNGNITGLERYGGVNPADNMPMKIDHLIYGYNGVNPNQLTKVDEDTDGNAAVGFRDVANTVDYVYDANGNMVKDFNKGIGTSTTDGIIYNHLNLPMKITFANGDKIEYFYQADGVKVQKVVTQGTTITTTDYIDGIQYTNNVLDFVPTTEGYVKYTVVGSTNTYSYVYNYTDHLGNVRLSYAKSPTNVLTVLEENNYYPFGMKHSGYNGDGYAFGSVSNALALVFNGAKSYQYKYNGKEFQGELGLDWSDYGARNYDASIGRWMNMDPLAEQYRRWSPYNYCVNNPMIYKDPDGMLVDLFLTGDDTAQVKAESLMNEGLGGEYSTVNKETGEVSLNVTEDQIKNFTKEQKGFYDVIKSAVDASKDISIGLTEGTSDVLIGDHLLEKIDIDDVNVFGTGEGVNKFSTFGHEIAEQQSKQLTGDDTTYTPDHKKGMEAEKTITGYERLNVPNPGVTQDPATGIINGTYRALYSGDTKGVSAQILIENSNVKNVTRTTVQY